MAAAYVPYTGPVVTPFEARATGLKRYFTGKPCLRGHLSERHLVNGRCRTCFYLLRKPPSERAKQTTRLWWRKWFAANLEKRRTQKKAYYYKNAAKVTAQNEAGRKRSPERARCAVRKHRAFKRGAAGFHTSADIADIMKRQGGRCAYCRRRLSKRFDVDHILALSLGGSNWPSNLQLTCSRCNRSKRAQDAIVFAQSSGEADMTVTLERLALAQPVERWEYWRLPITNAHDTNLATLNELGAQGWELVSVGAMHYWLKRRV